MNNRRCSHVRGGPDVSCTANRSKQLVFVVVSYSCSVFVLLSACFHSCCHPNDISSCTRHQPYWNIFALNTYVRSRGPIFGAKRLRVYARHRQAQLASVRPSRMCVDPNFYLVRMRWLKPGDINFMSPMSSASLDLLS